MGGATVLRFHPGRGRGISIHAPRGGSDVNSWRKHIVIDNFNPRSPWGERQEVYNDAMWSKIFQSTLPVGGATSNNVSIFPQPLLFQSTLPVGGATALIMLNLQRTRISIHAPRGGSDLLFLLRTANRDHFNPRSPWGERRLHPPPGPEPPYFNPRSPWGERLFPALIVDRPIGISIHAPRGGSDWAILRWAMQIRYFNPRSPWGERPGAFVAA